MDTNDGPAGPLRALQTSISRACNELGGKLHSIAEGGEQHRQRACRLLAELGERAGVQVRRLQDNHQQHQQHAIAGFAVRDLDQLICGWKNHMMLICRPAMCLNMLYLLTHSVLSMYLDARILSCAWCAVDEPGWIL